MIRASVLITLVVSGCFATPRLAKTPPDQLLDRILKEFNELVVRPVIMPSVRPEMTVELSNTTVRTTGSRLVIDGSDVTRWQKAKVYLENENVVCETRLVMGNITFSYEVVKIYINNAQYDAKLSFVPITYPVDLRLQKPARSSKKCTLTLGPFTGSLLKLNLQIMTPVQDSVAKKAIKDLERIDALKSVFFHEAFEQAVHLPLYLLINQRSFCNSLIR